MQTMEKKSLARNAARQLLGLAFVAFILATVLMGMKTWASSPNQIQDTVIKVQNEPKVVSQAIQMRRSLSNRQLRRLQRMRGLTRALAKHIR